MDRDPEAYLFEDEELEAFLSLEGGSVKLACALAFETIAADQAFVLKAIKLLSLSTDGPKVAAEFRAQAKELRAQAAEEGLSSLGSFDVIEQVLDHFTARELRAKQVVRGE